MSEEDEHILALYAKLLRTNEERAKRIFVLESEVEALRSRYRSEILESERLRGELAHLQEYSRTVEQAAAFFWFFGERNLGKEKDGGLLHDFSRVAKSLRHYALVTEIRDGIREKFRKERGSVDLVA